MKQIDEVYDAWLRSLSTERREYIESRAFPRLFKEAFTAGWSACCEVAYDQPLLGHRKLITEPPMDNPSKLPSCDPNHVCGVFCDGQDGRSSKCATERRAAKELADRKRLNVDVGDAYHNCPSCGWMGTKPCQTHAVLKPLLGKKDRLSWYCDNRDRAGVERGPILLNGEIWGYQEKNEAIQCAKRNGKRLKILPDKIKKRKKAKKAKKSSR